MFEITSDRPAGGPTLPTADVCGVPPGNGIAITETLSPAPTANVCGGVGVDEHRAVESVEWRRLVELQRVARDVETLAREFTTTHVKLCGCEVCRFWAAKGGPTATAARKLTRTIAGLAKVGAAIRAGVRACAPAVAAEFDRPAEVTKRGIERARRRLAASRGCCDPKADG
ncbi:hypothetical protein [Limnoglobus roseus]|uniref:Uncharacterized protein n=1 Tax=Limnoglobus roseus TaxID=2598579 RepID=A0A5C1APQ6_9BACT|nr:hypothetical protein [Limnoglobus roseus]QEL18848.1 hypothetical protein PX52LOC_05889 [Limnoglobus roseus]